MATGGAALGADPPGTEIEQLLDRAEGLIHVAVSEAGAGRSFEEALALVEDAQSALGTLDASPDRRAELARQVAGVQESLDLARELSEDRFYGVFPLARLVVPTILADGGLELTEQLFHAPEIAAIDRAAGGLAGKAAELDHPHIVLRSVPAVGALRESAREALLKEGLALPVTRRHLSALLDDDALALFDEGTNDPEVIARLLEGLDTAHLLVVTVEPEIRIDQATVKVVLTGDLWTPGEVVQGSSTDASLVVREASIAAFGVARDRRDQFWRILGLEALMLGFAMIWAARIRWNVTNPLKVLARVAIGVGLFLFGRFYVLVIVVLMRRFLPASNDLVLAAFWWPASLGLLTILGGGLFAWLVQARLTDIMPGTRGARAVGTIFALTALGACSYFVEPLLLLDGAAGTGNLVPFVIATLGLAVLFGFAARTGPPVPHYFMLGPLAVAPLVGVSLLMASPLRLWLCVGLVGLLAALALARHRYAVAHGTEETEPTQEEAAAKDQERLERLRKKLSTG